MRVGSITPIERNLGILPENHDANYQKLEKDEYFLLLAFLTSKRSHDAQTQHGCILVRDGIVVSTGYNGFIRGARDEELPNLRPAKYKFIIHSEANAMLNAARLGIALDGATAYITGQPCPECAKKMIQTGIKEWIWVDDYCHSTAKEEKELLDYLIAYHAVKARTVSLNKADLLSRILK